MKILIDNGHGLETPCKRSPCKILHHLNLSQVRNANTALLLLEKIHNAFPHSNLSAQYFMD